MIRKAFLCIAIAALLMGVSVMPASAGWSDLIKDRLYMRTLRTLEGRAFVDHPISGATVRIYNRSGALLYTISSATKKDGRFSITRRLPESFKVVIKGGATAGKAFDGELARYIYKFDQTARYKVNAVTTLLAKHLERHPKKAFGDAEKAVEKFLSLPESVVLDKVIYSSEWYCYYFSHYFFMKEAKANQGMTAFVGQLAEEMDAGKTRSFYDGTSIGSSFFQDAFSSLLQGAMSEVGSEGAGWILGLLNKGGNDTDTRLAEMQTDLQEVLSDLDQIINALTALAQQLALDTNQVETYIQGGAAQAAISTIKTHYGPDDQNSEGDTNTLKYFSYCTVETCSDTATQTAIQTLAANINGAWDIEDQVQAIHDAIIPDIGNTEGLLDLWTGSFLLQGPISSDQLMSYYQTLEQYFAVLLFYQFKGANLIVEAKNYLGTGDAASYLTGTFQPMIQEETDRFLYCVLELIANNCGLYWEGSFLPGTAQDILARATFFIAQTLGDDHFGLRTGIFGTGNLVHDVQYMGGTNETSPNNYTFVSAEGVWVDVDADTRPYDFWGTLTNQDFSLLQEGTTYTLLKVDLGAMNPQTSTVKYSTDNNNWSILGNATITTYTPQYVQDPDGTISYGYFLAPFRIGGKEAIMDPSSFKQDQYTVNKSGNVNYNGSGSLDSNNNLDLSLNANDHYTNSSSSISQKLEWAHAFTFSGSASTTAYVNIAGAVTGSVYFCDGTESGNMASISLNVGVWDATHQKAVTSISFGTSASNNCNKQNWSATPNNQLTLTLDPGVSYYVYANVEGAGQNTNGDYSYEIDLNSLTHLSVTFVNSEF